MGEVTAEFKTATNREAAMVSAGEAMELTSENIYKDIENADGDIATTAKQQVKLGDAKMSYAAQTGAVSNVQNTVTKEAEAAKQKLGQ